MSVKTAISLSEEIITTHTSSKAKVDSYHALGGGSINEAYTLKVGEELYFMKWNYSDRYPSMFEKEAEGLKILQSSLSGLIIPHVMGFKETDNTSVLVLEYIESGRGGKDFSQNFGHMLAELHKNTSEKFGLNHDNYIGSLPQYNDFQENWIDFFMIQRIEKQIKMARDRGYSGKELSSLFEKLYPHLSDFFPKEKPSLLHGDLWSGNYMIAKSGEACILDPAVYYGHRLMDIGMSLLFGGFSEDFYQSYHRAYPMERNWREAAEIANLYPLMVHVNLFGGGYLQSVKSILKRF